MDALKRLTQQFFGITLLWRQDNFYHISTSVDELDTFLLVYFLCYLLTHWSWRITLFDLVCSDYLFKLLLIGDSGVGKSCLLLRFAVSLLILVFFFLSFPTFFTLTLLISDAWTFAMFDKFLSAVELALWTYINLESFILGSPWRIYFI